MHADRYFALVDILGFKNMVLSEPLEIIVERIQRLLDITASRVSTWVNPELSVAIGRYHFSDTLLLWSPPIDSENSKQEERISFSFYGFITHLLQEAIFSSIPLRGAITYGSTWIDDSRGIVVGKPVADAHALEQDQNWIGVAIHDTCLERPLHEEMGIFIVGYRPPLKLNRPDVSRAVIDWTTPLKVNQENHKKARGFDAQARFAEVIKHGLKQPQEVKQKYLNTQEFVAQMQKTRPVKDAYGVIPPRSDA